MREENTEAGWWVPSGHWFEQKLWPLTGCWQQVRCADGSTIQACILSGRNGWWDGNYEPVPGVVEWFKPSKWFAGPNDMSGKEVEWIAYKAEAFSNRSPLRHAV